MSPPHYIILGGRNLIISTCANGSILGDGLTESQPTKIGASEIVCLKGVPTVERVSQLRVFFPVMVSHRSLILFANFIN